MLKIFKAMIYSYYMTKSLALTHKEDFEGALLLLKKSTKNRTFSNEIYCTYEGFLLAATGDVDAALVSFKKLYEYIKSDKSRLNEDEKIYLLNYATVVLAIHDVYEKPFLLSNEYDTDNVAKHIVSKFPFEKMH